MKLEDQVASLDLAIKLEELMPRRECLFAYYGNAGTWDADAIVEMAMYKDVDDEFRKHKLLPAYTVAELGEMLPDGFSTIHTTGHGWRCFYNKYTGKFSGVGFCSSDTEADARAKMLVYLLENKLITV